MISSKRVNLQPLVSVNGRNDRGKGDIMLESKKLPIRPDQGPDVRLVIIRIACE